MNGICILVPQANISDGGFAKLAPLRRTVIFLFYFILYFTVMDVGLVGLTLYSFKFVMGVLGSG